MCKGCGKVPLPAPVKKAYNGLSTKEAVTAAHKERSFCPKCKKKMTLQPGGIWLCRDCGVTRR